MIAGLLLFMAFLFVLDRLEARRMMKFQKAHEGHSFWQIREEDRVVMAVCIVSTILAIPTLIVGIWFRSHETIVPRKITPEPVPGQVISQTGPVVCIEGKPDPEAPIYMTEPNIKLPSEIDLDCSLYFEDATSKGDIHAMLIQEGDGYHWRIYEPTENRWARVEFDKNTSTYAPARKGGQDFVIEFRREEGKP